MKLALEFPHMLTFSFLSPPLPSSAMSLPSPLCLPPFQGTGLNSEEMQNLNVLQSKGGFEPTNSKTIPSKSHRALLN